MQFVVARLRRLGTVRAGWIGARLQDVTPEIAEAIGLDRPGGAIVVSADANEPAAEAGVSVGDVVTAVDGTRYPGARQTVRAIGRIDVGQHATVTTFRDGTERQIEVTVVEFPGDAVPAEVKPASATLAAIAEKPDFGIKLATLTEAMRDRYGKF